MLAVAVRATFANFNVVVLYAPHAGSDRSFEAFWATVVVRFAKFGGKRMPTLWLMDANTQFSDMGGSAVGPIGYGMQSKHAPVVAEALDLVGCRLHTTFDRVNEFGSQAGTHYSGNHDKWYRIDYIGTSGDHTPYAGCNGSAAGLPDHVHLLC